MTIGQTVNRVSFNTDGVTTVFPVNLQSYLASDFTAILTNAAGVETTLTLNSDYSLVSSGTLAPPFWTLTRIGTAWASGQTLQVFTNPAQTQQTQYVQGQAFPSLAVQTNMDRLTQMVQRLQDEVSRTIRATDGDVNPLMLLPVASSRANTALVFDALGNSTTGFIPTNVFTQVLWDAFLAATTHLYPLFNLGQSAAELAVSATPVNLWYPPGYVDRYATNVTPGTTDMGPALNLAIKVALAVNGSGQNGVKVIFLNGAYSIATQPTYGTVNPSNMLPLIIEGQGWGTQIICNTTASSAALFDMGGRIGWTLRNFYMMGNDAHKNDGIHAGAIGGTLQTQWLIENVYSQIAGESFKIADTNGGFIRHCSAWIDQPPSQIVPQTVTAANISYMLHLAGSFVNNCSIRDCVFLPNHNNLVTTAVQIDCTTSEGVEIDTIDVESGSGANTENGIVVTTVSSITSLTLKNIYCEGTAVSLTGVFNSNFEGINDGGAGGNLVLQSQCRDNTFTGINIATMTDNSSTNFGNTFIGCLFRTSWTETVAGNSRRINCTVAGPAFVDWGGSANEVIPYTASMTPLCNSSKGAFRIVATNGTAFTINAPTNPVDGYALTLTILNTSGGALGVATFNGIFKMSTWTQPANGFSRSITFIYNTVNWIQVAQTGIDVTN
jgi:hypothetical protein